MCASLPGQRLSPDGKSVIHPTLAEANAEVARIIAEEDAARAAKDRNIPGNPRQ